MTKHLDLSPYRNDDNTVSKYAWPGGYPLFYLTADNGVLCPSCVQDARPDAPDADQTNDWKVVAADVNWEDADLTCDHCSTRIESAYGETK
jgi:hypothetical protein